MQVLVASDSHGRAGQLQKIIEDNKSATHFIFLGDGLRDLEKTENNYPHIKFYKVAGNCDFGSFLGAYDIISIAKTEILITHGHSFSVKTDRKRLMEFAKNAGAKVALYGHTHIPLIEYDYGIITLNPGSCAEGRNGKQTYAILEIENGKIMPKIIEI